MITNINMHRVKNLLYQMSFCGMSSTINATANCSHASSNFGHIYMPIKINKINIKNKYTSTNDSTTVSGTSKKKKKLYACIYISFYNHVRVNKKNCHVNFNMTHS